MIWIAAFVLWCICGAIGAAICRPKNRMEQGAVLGFFLGPIGVLIAYLLPSLPASQKSVTPGSGKQKTWASDVRCKNCDMKLHANYAQLKEGIRCPRCGAEVTAS